MVWIVGEHGVCNLCKAKLGTADARVKLDPWVSVGALPPGALFRTRDGILAVKSEYHLADGRSQCVLLASGEYAWFPNGDREEAQELGAGECAYLGARGNAPEAPPDSSAALLEARRLLGTYRQEHDTLVAMDSRARIWLGTGKVADGCHCIRCAPVRAFLRSDSERSEPAGSDSVGSKVVHDPSEEGR